MILLCAYVRNANLCEIKIWKYVFFFSSLLLNSILTAFKPTYIGERAMDFVNLITTIEDDGNSIILQ